MVGGLEDDGIPRKELAACLCSCESDVSRVVLEVVGDRVSDQLVQQDPAEIELAEGVEGKRYRSDVGGFRRRLQGQFEALL